MIKVAVNVSLFTLLGIVNRSSLRYDHRPFVDDGMSRALYQLVPISKLECQTGADCALSHDDDWRFAPETQSWNGTCISAERTTKALTQASTIDASCIDIIASKKISVLRGERNCQGYSGGDGSISV